MTVRTVLLSLALLLASCDAGGQGTLRVHLSGEQPALTGYPFDDGVDVVGFVDGWTLEYTKVLVSVGRFSLSTTTGEKATLDVDPVVADLHLGDARAWELRGIPARRWDRLSFDVVPPTEGTRALPGVLAADVDRMRTQGLALLVEGVARNGGAAIPFSFGFHERVRAYDCVSGTDGTRGAVVRSNAIDEVELTFHLDHLFLDSLVVPEPSMRFEPLAALAGPDSLLTLDDLQHPITDLADRSGTPLVVDGSALVYDPGSFLLDEGRSIASYVEASATTMPHLDGEGHCGYVTPP